MFQMVDSAWIHYVVKLFSFCNSTNWLHPQHYYETNDVTNSGIDHIWMDLYIFSFFYYKCDSNLN